MELIRIEREIQATASRAWALVSDFGGLVRWNPHITDCAIEGQGVGAIRTVRYQDGLVVRERLAMLDGDARRLTYDFLSGAALPVTHFGGGITIAEPTPHTCRVGWSYRGEYPGPGCELTDFVATIASRTVSRIADLEIAASEL